MGSGWHFRGWLLMGLLSALLLIAVCVPAAYFTEVRTRTIYVAVVAPMAWALYVMLVYLILYRPVVRSSEVYSQGVYCGDSQERSVTLITKEMYKLNRNIIALSNKEHELTYTTDKLNSHLENDTAPEA